MNEFVVPTPARRDSAVTAVFGFHNVDGHQLTYYQNWDCTNTSTAALLAGGDGQCGSWATLFIDAMGAQGIDHTNDYIKFETDLAEVPGAGGFLVANWTYATGTGLSGDAAYPYLIVRQVPYEGAGQYLWEFTEVTDNTGTPGQGNANPASLFQDHQIVKLGTTYYDRKRSAVCNVAFG